MTVRVGEWLRRQFRKCPVCKAWYITHLLLNVSTEYFEMPRKNIWELVGAPLTEERMVRYILERQYVLKRK